MILTKLIFWNLNHVQISEYKIIDGKFIKRTIEEIEQLYKNWVDGSLALKGESLEINAFFKYLIEKIKTKEISLEANVDRLPHI